jgi:hypothetical protein
VAAVLAPAGPAAASKFFATAVDNRVVGSSPQAGFQDPALALGGPQGAGDGQAGFHVLNLGVGGSATLTFDDGPTRRSIADAPGPDFIVFENAFYAAGDTTASFAELMFVDVSTNGRDFARFPVTSLTAGPVGAFGTIDPASVSGFAGVHPVYANVATNTIDPFDPAAAGGDAFDLAALRADPAAAALIAAGSLDLNDVRYVRLVDVLGDGSLTDRDGRPIYDPTGSGSGGADVDAVAVINGVTAPEPGMAVVAACGAGLTLMRRRRAGGGARAT